MEKSNANRRSALRVEDSILLRVSSVPLTEMQDLDTYFEHRRSSLSVQAHISYCTGQKIPQMRIIERKHPEIASYLRYLESQIQYLSTSLEKVLDMDGNSVSAQKVCLSAGGIQFETDSEFDVKVPLELRLSLIEKSITILVFATIKRIEGPENGLYTVTTQFSNIHEEDKELLIKHVHQTHVEQLREKKME